MKLETITQASTLIIQAAVAVVAVIGWARGWWKNFRKFTTFAERSNLFIEKILPDILGHFSETGRLPKDTLINWTKCLSGNGGLVRSSSPLQVTEKGKKLAEKIQLLDVFSVEENKELLSNIVRESLGKKKATRYDIETESISAIAKAFSSNSNSIFSPVKNYLFEHPGEVKTSDIYFVAGLMLRDHIFSAHSDWIEG